MSFYGKLSMEVSGVNAFAKAFTKPLNETEDITVGYKAGSKTFSTLLSSSKDGISYSSNGITAKYLKDKEDNINESSTDNSYDEEEQNYDSTSNSESVIDSLGNQTEINDNS